MMYAESLLLLKNRKQDWSKTFTTYLLPSDKASGFNWYADMSVSADDAEVSLFLRKAKSLPTGRAAEYARSGIATNSEKYNLNVKQNVGNERKFNVVQSSDVSQMPIYIGGAIGVSIILLGLIYQVLGRVALLQLKDQLA